MGVLDIGHFVDNVSFGGREETLLNVPADPLVEWHVFWRVGVDVVQSARTAVLPCGLVCQQEVAVVYPKQELG